MNFEKPPQPISSEPGSEKLESIETLVEKNLEALQEFITAHHEGEKEYAPLETIFDEYHLEKFRHAWSEPNGYHEWTPMLQAFKRITASYPTIKTEQGKEMLIFATVVANGDKVDQKLTEELNAAITNKTSGQWSANALKPLF